ncbi:hypothetical protein NDA13_004904 [Ustilago tritici]|nr:hypothetical protein NDA13_004904 [Ustilago tritici]
MLNLLRKKEHLPSREASSSPETPPMSERRPGQLSEYAESINSEYNEKGPESSNSIGMVPSADQAWIDARDGYQIMATYLWKFCSRRNFFSENPDIPSGVALRFAKGQYVVCPATDERLGLFFRAVAILNVEAAMTITSPVVSAINTRLAPGTEQIPITPSQHIQVVDTMEQLAGARKAQNACFIRRENTVVTWCDHVEQLEERAQDLEEKMIKFVWRSSYANNSRNILVTASSSSVIDTAMSDFNQNQARFQSLSSAGHGTSFYGAGAGSDAHSIAPSNPFSESHAVNGSPESAGSPTGAPWGNNTGSDPEKQEKPAAEERPLNYQAPLQHGLAVGLDVAKMGLAAVTILMFPVIMFFCDNVIGVIFQILGPIRQIHQNSRYYSGKPPTRISGQLPHITIQMPVYKESMEGVLIPTIESVKKAISTYELQGGTASIIVSEDGMQLVSQAEQALRHDFYEKNNIGWVARPGHGMDGYLRKGRFKKASNLNFTCHLSLAVEKTISEHRPQTPQALAVWTEADETDLYNKCLQKCLPELHSLAQARGNVRIGDLVLLIDSDTRVPEDCLLDAASEMVQCPDVGVLQHCSGVMIVSDSYFELGISFFTRLVNFAISYMVAAGDMAPFVGHNAILRWSAMQEASFIDPEDGIRKIWSESHVSEDFDMALRLLMSGYITRWATYSNNGFEEGVPFTKLFRTFLFSNAPVHYKFSACSYIFSYYAIACAFPLTLALYLVQGWFYPTLLPLFLAPFQIWVAVVVVFTAGGNVGQILARYRAKVDGLFPLIKEHIIWIPYMFIFFGGLSYHVLTALLAHPVGYNMSWGATIKDLEDSNFFIEVPIILKRFWKTLILAIACIVAVIVFQLSNVLPLEWQIQGFFIFWSLLLTSILHILYPIALNPALLRFSF